MDMEDRILMQNVPGQWSSFDDSREENRHLWSCNFGDDENDHDEDENEKTSASRGNIQQFQNVNDKENFQRHSSSNVGNRKFNTGIKGVMADHAEHLENERLVRNEVVAQRTHILNQMVKGTTTDVHLLSLQDLQHSSVESKQIVNIENRDINEEEEEESDYDAYLKLYREKRLQELKKQQQTPSKSFLEVLEVNNEQFLKEIEENGVITVVHLFDRNCQKCVRMNGMLEEIAKTVKTVKFLRMNVRENNLSIDRTQLPILSIYTSGECRSVLAGIENELGCNRYTANDVQWLLETTIHNLKINV